MSDITVEPTKGILALRRKRMSKNYKFIGSDITIQKLTVGEVKAIQDKAKELEASKSEDDDGLEILELVIKSSVVDAEGLTRSDFEAWPMDELNLLSNAIMAYSGFSGSEKGKSD